jgi:proteasome lid subunit RPN8/RPN11
VLSQNYTVRIQFIIAFVTIDTPLTERTRRDIRTHAFETLPYECCGVVVVRDGKQIVCRCRNLSDRPEKEFIASLDDVRQALSLGTLICLYHSHTNGCKEFSKKDLAQMKLTKNLPWYLVNPREGTEDYLNLRG